MKQGAELQKLFDYYELTHPLPKELTKYIKDSMDKNFEEILKDEGGLCPFFILKSSCYECTMVHPPELNIIF